MGLFLWPLVLGLIAAAAWFADRQPIAPEPASRVWGMIHGMFLLLGTVTVMVGFVAGLMYLVQAIRLKRKHLSSGGIQLPSLEWLEHVNSRVVLASALMVGVGFLAGIILNLIGGKTQLPWTDPVVWSSGLMLAWLVAAALFNVFYKPARHGRKVAYLTVVSFVFLAVVLGMLLLVNTQHGGQKRSPHALCADRWEAEHESANGRLQPSQFAGRDARALAFGPHQVGPALDDFRADFRRPRPCCCRPAIASRSTRPSEDAEGRPQPRGRGPVRGRLSRP